MTEEKLQIRIGEELVDQIDYRLAQHKSASAAG